MPTQLKVRSVPAVTIKDMLGDGTELALIDVREELTFSQNHLLWARNLPLSRLELQFARRVPRLTTRIVLCDDNDGLAKRAATILANAGYTDLSYLQGGVAAWAAAGFVLFSGVHVPSKAFGEFVEHDSGTPSISADELDAMMRKGTDIKVLDSRPFDEYARISIPTGINVPGAELVLRVRDVVNSPETTIVVNCAGRTRSIIGAQSLINAGVPNKVVALRNGTMGWHLAGLACDSGENARAPAVSGTGLKWAKSAAAAVARKFNIEHIDVAKLNEFRADPKRTTYIFDVRDPDEYAAGHFPGAVSAPGGQLVQATDEWVAVRGARLVLFDDDGIRARMAASWLVQMGWDASVVGPDVVAASDTGMPAPRRPVLPDPGTATIDVADLAQHRDRWTVVDLSRSPAYAKGRIPGAHFVLASRFVDDLPRLPGDGPVLLTSHDGAEALFALADASAATHRDVFVLAGGTQSWIESGRALEQDHQSWISRPDDIYKRPYEGTNNATEAMQAYIDWELHLVAQLANDSISNFHVV